MNAFQKMAKSYRTHVDSKLAESVLGAWRDRNPNIVQAWVQSAEECEVRRMLGCWVSGLEPALARGPEGELLGLTIDNLPLGMIAPIVVKVQSRNAQ
jgi:hypothetical protein